MKGALLATAATLLGSALANVPHARRHDAFHQRRNQMSSSAMPSSSSVPVDDGNDCTEEPAPVTTATPTPQETCGCTTEVITFYGSPTWVPTTPSSVAPVSTETPTETPTTVTSKKTTTQSSTSYTTVTVKVTPSPSETTPSQAPSPSTPAPSSESTPSQAPSSTPAPAPTSTPSLPTPGVTSFSSTGVYTIPATTLTVTDTTTVCGATSTEVPSGTHTYGGVTTVVETSTTVTCPVATVKPSGSTVTSTIETTTYVCPSSGTYTIHPTTTVVPSSTCMVYPTPQTVTPGTYTQPEQTMTVTRTDYTYVCPFTNGNEPTSAPQSPATTPASPTSPPQTPAETPTQTPNTPENTPTGKPAPGPQAKGNRMGMTYAPFTANGGCKSQASMDADMAKVAQNGFSNVRVYSTQCNTLEYIGEACRKHGLKMIVGIFIDSSGISGAKSQVQDIVNWAQWDLVSMVVVGNEAIFNGYCSASALAGFMNSCRSQLSAAGYHGEVTTAEPINIWQEHGSALCGSVDRVGANVHPFFNPHTTAEQAGKFAKSEFAILNQICPGKRVVNLETGWPSQGSANGVAVPGTQQQATAVMGIANAVGSDSVFFSYDNDMWKAPGNLGIGQYWGCINVFN